MISCVSNQEFNEPYKSKRGLSETKSVHNPDPYINLTTHLRSFSGLIIQGEGANAKLSVRGINSFTSGTEPLIILDGGPVSSYYDLYSMLPVTSIKRIQVLKNPNDIAIYGVRGANGVIKITSKRS